MSDIERRPKSTQIIAPATRDNLVFDPVDDFREEEIWDDALTHVLSENSRRVYRTSLTFFAKYILARARQEIPEDSTELMYRATPYLKKVNFRFIAQYREYLRHRGLAASTINLRLAAINMLYQRMQRLELIKDNPCSSTLVARMKCSPVSNTEGLSNEEASRLISICHHDDSHKGRRDTAILAIMIYNGLRREEVCSLDIDKIAFVNETPTYNVRVKGNKRYVIEIIPQVWAAIEKWISKANINEGPLFKRIFKSKAGLEKIFDKRLTPNGIYNIITTRAKDAKIKKNIHPHSLRHTYATLALLAGVPIQDVQISMGHTSTNTTFRYYRAINQVGRSPGRSLKLNWNAQQIENGKEKNNEEGAPSNGYSEEN